MVAITGDLFKIVHFRIHPQPVLTSSDEIGIVGVSGQYGSYWNAFLFHLNSTNGIATELQVSSWTVTNTNSGKDNFGKWM